MAEYERVREQALLTDEELRQAVAEYATVGFTSMGYEGLMKLLPLIAQAQLDKALKTDGIETRADVQSLPDNPHHPLVDRKFGTFGEGQDSMLKAGFIKVIPKEE